MKKFLHVGCGPRTKANIPKGLNTAEWREIRFDIDPNVKPDIVGAMTDMSQVATASMDALYSSHNIEHVFAHEVPVTLKEFHRVLNPAGFVVITCPDLQTVCEAVANDRLLESLYVSPSGPIATSSTGTGHRWRAAMCTWLTSADLLIPHWFVRSWKPDSEAPLAAGVHRLSICGCWPPKPAEARNS